MNYIALLTLLRREVDRFTRVAIQSVVSPWISATLFLVVFGNIVGTKIGLIEGIPYKSFVLPGILTMNVVMNSFMQSSTSLYFMRFMKSIEELLVAPLSYAEMIIGFLFGAISRGFVIGIIIAVTGMFFGATQMVHPLWFIFYLTLITTIFGLLGLIVGLWAEGFEALSVFPTFLLTPLSFLGGMFNSIHMLPAIAQPIARLNPMYYLVEGMRYSMTGISEAPRLLGAFCLTLFMLVLFFLCVRLFKNGWHIRA